MKKIIILAAALGLALGLCACGNGAVNGPGNDLLSAASPETSALMLYSCADGKSVKELTMYDTGVEREIFDKLAKVTAAPAANWTAKDVTVPVYGLEIGRNDDGIGSLEAAWSNGYLILADGSAYKFDFDFAALETQYEWLDSEEGLAIGRLPCSHALSLCGDEWISSMLTPAAELSPPEGISLTLDYLDYTDPDNGLAAVTFSNDSGEEWTYGTYYHLEVELDGAWYVLPAFSGYVFNDIAMLLPAGEEQQEIYWLAPYGELPAGRYRLVAEGMAAEFVLEASCVPNG